MKMEAIFLFVIAHCLLMVFGQQYFKVKPHDTSVILGRKAELHCHVANRIGLVQWSKDGFLLGYDPEIPGYERYEMRVDHTKSAYTLLVREARLEDEAEFQCQVSPGKEGGKPIRSVARITVLVPPKYLSINGLPNGSEIEVREAEKVVLQCQAFSSKPATILKWYRKNVELMQEASKTTVRREGEKLYSTLSFITLYPKGDISGSSYTCEALHPALEKPLKTSVNVGVLYPPRHPDIKGYRIDDIVYAGDRLTLVCSSSGGKPRADLQWYRNGEVIDGTFSNVGRDSTNTLTFIASNADNGAVYKCEASNPLTRVPLVATIKISVLFPPSEVLIEGPREGKRGETITLSCRTDVSNPPAELLWLIDGVTFESQNSASHVIQNGWYTTSNITAILTRQGRDEKIFTCIAHTSSSRHDRISQNFNVSILYPPEMPSISGYDDNSEIREGDHQSFTCSALAGNPPGDLRWYRGEVQMKGITNLVKAHISSVLSFEVDAEDNGVAIRCKVNNTSNMVPLTAEVTLSVLFPPPNVTIFMDPVHPREGETVRLECWSGSSNPPASIIWWKDNTVLQKQPQYQTTNSAYGGTSTRSTISVQLTSADHGTQYVCEATSKAFQRSVQDHVTLNVLYAPVFLTPGKVVELIEGRSGQFNMTAQSNPDIHSYRWSRNGNNIPGRPDLYKEDRRITMNGPIIFFNHVSRHDSGSYTCIAQNPEGSASTTLTLNVLYPSTVFNITGNLEIAEGDTAHIECSADGNPLPEETITWKWQGDSDRTPLLASHSEHGHSFLTIANITRRDTGSIECVADNGIGTPSIKRTNMSVLYRPIILKNLLHRRVAVGESNTAEVTCLADGFPDVTFVWSFNGSNISCDSRTRSCSHQVRKKPGEWSSKLTIHSLTSADYGIYTCVAGNQLGHDVVTFGILKKSAPDPPDALEFLNVSHQSTLLIWSPGFDGGIVQSFLLKIRKNQETHPSFLHVPMNSTSYILSGLQQGTSYEVSIAAKNDLGQSVYSLPVTLRTKSLPMMGSTVSDPDMDSGSRVEFLPAWLLTAAVIGGLVVVTNLLVCIIYVRKKVWCRSHQAATGSPASESEESGEKLSKKIPSEEHSPFYLTGTSVDLSEERLNADTFQQKASSVKLHQVSRESSEDGQSSGRHCECGGRQWSSPLMCGSMSHIGEDTTNQYQQCPDILKRDSCHCHPLSSLGKRVSEMEVEMASSLGAVMYGKKDRHDYSTECQDYIPCEPPGPPQITLTTFQSKSELPIRHTIIGPKLETVINGHDKDS